MTRTQIVHGSIAALALLGSIGAYALWHGHVHALATEAAQIRAELTARGNAGGRAAASRQLYEELAANETKVFARFVEEAEVVPYLESLEETGEEQGAVVEVDSVGKPAVKAGQPGYLQIVLRVRGSFDAVVRTLGAIEYQAYDTRLTSLTLDSPGAIGWTATATFEVGTGPAAATTTASTP